MRARSLAPFGTTIFSEMTEMAATHSAINLSQGFPDFDGPVEIVEAAYAAMRARENQYARSQGHPDLTRAISAQRQRDQGIDYDPTSEVIVFAGATEGIAASLLGLLNPGDEVILFEPFYDSYPALVARADAIPRFATLRYPEFRIEEATLRPLFNPRTRVLILNSPHNPTGRVFDAEELAIVARLCQEFDTTVIADEVYEHLTYDGLTHRSIATLPGMRERTLALSSAGKTFSFTGWKIGWGTGPEQIVRAAQAAHQFLTFAVARPLQVGIAHGLQSLGIDYFEQYRRDYTARRDCLTAALSDFGLHVVPPQGTYFVVADFSALSDLDDRAYVRHLVAEKGVAAIPLSPFYSSMPASGRQLVRFAFCKHLATLRKAGARLNRPGP